MESGIKLMRVPMDFDWPKEVVWMGYIFPEGGGRNYHLPDEFADKYYELWREKWRFDPPEGPGYQLWEYVTEGSPVSPVFASIDELATWCSTASLGIYKMTKDEWVKWISGNSVSYQVGNIVLI